MFGTLTNSIVPDEPHSAVSLLGLCCLVTRISSKHETKMKKKSPDAPKNQSGHLNDKDGKVKSSHID